MSTKIVLSVLLITGFLYPTAAGVIKADTEPIGADAPIRLTVLTDTAIQAVSTPPRKVMAVSIASAKPAPTATLASAKVASVSAKAYQVVGYRTVSVSAYSSTPEETDDTPFITASNTHVRDGIIATNQLPFGTKVRIPSLFGDKIFVVEDRMHVRMTNNVDIWMPSKSLALQFGRKTATVEILK